MTIYKLLINNVVTNFTNKERLEIVRNRRKIIGQYRIIYPNLYNLNKRNNDLEWNNLTIYEQRHLLVIGYTQKIWNNGEWPMKIGINLIYDTIKLKYKVSKIIQNNYNKIKFEWIKVTKLYDSGRALTNNKTVTYIFNLPNDLRNIILYKYLEI